MSNEIKKLYENRKASKTMYNFRNYRSRLEASWACYFDYLRIKFIYEPYDLDGWIPDFLIKSKHEDQPDILVEVKPIDLEFKIPSSDYINEIYKKAINHKGEYIICLLGLEPFLLDGDTWVMGYIYNPHNRDADRDDTEFDYLALKFGKDEEYDLSELFGIWANLIGNVDCQKNTFIQKL